MKTKQHSPTEKQFTVQVIQLAQLCGWKVLHIRAARTVDGWRTPVQGDGKGFPDLLMVRTREGDRRVIAAELKVRKNRPTDEQAEWLVALSLAGVRAVLWYPESWDEIETTLRG